MFNFFDGSDFSGSFPKSLGILSKGFKTKPNSYPTRIQSTSHFAQSVSLSIFVDFDVFELSVTTPIRRYNTSKRDVALEDRAHAESNFQMVDLATQCATQSGRLPLVAQHLRHQLVCEAVIPAVPPTSQLKSNPESEMPHDTLRRGGNRPVQ